MFSIHQYVRKNSPILDNAGTDARNTKSQKISSEDWHWIKIRYGLSSKFKDWENCKTFKSFIYFQFM